MVPWGQYEVAGNDGPQTAVSEQGYATLLDATGSSGGARYHISGQQHVHDVYGGPT